MQSFSSFKEFYPFYLDEHKHPINKLLHVIGSASVLALIGWAITKQDYILLYWLPVIGYGFAWIGHFFFEKNKPATFKYPLYSFIGDWVMFKDVLTGRVGF